MSLQNTILESSTFHCAHAVRLEPYNEQSALLHADPERNPSWHMLKCSSQGLEMVHLRHKTKNMQLLQNTEVVYNFRYSGVSFPHFQPSPKRKGWFRFQE